MSDQQTPNRLEAELARMRPSAISPELLGGIVRRVGHAGSMWSDRLLASAMAAGALAACVIVAVLMGDPSGSATPASPGAFAHVTGTNEPSLGNYLLAVARAGGDGGDRFQRVP